MEAEALTQIPRLTLRRKLQAGKLAGREVLKKSRPVWEISQSAVDQLLSKKQHQSYQELVSQWEADQYSGYHTGKPLTQSAIHCNLYGLLNYWKHLGVQPSFDGLSPENFRRAIADVPIDHAQRNCHFTKKEQMFKGLCSFYKLLIQKGIKESIELAELRKYKPKRVYPPKKKSLSQEQVVQLLEFNEIWMTSRTDFDRELTRTLIILITQTGLRRAEVINLMLEDVDLGEGTIIIVDGKGHKRRVVGITAELEPQLQRWLAQYRPKTASPNLLVQENGDPLTTSVIYPRITRLAEAAGLQIDVHGLRRTFATVMENKRMPWSVMQKALGHSSIKTTQGYIMTDERKVIDWMRNYGSAQPEQPQPVQQQPAPPAKPTINSMAYLQMLNDGF